MSRIGVRVNGVVQSFDDGATVAELVDRVAESPKGIAVAVNESVVPRSTWATVALVDGDRVELLTAAQGG